MKNKQHTLTLAIMLSLFVIAAFPAQASFAPSVQKPVPIILSILPNVGPAGTKVFLAGVGFTKTGNVIDFGGTSIFGLASNGFTLSFKVPVNAAPGNMAVSVKNSNGTSNMVNFTVIPAPAPTIISIAPTIGFVGAKVIIVGVGFTPSKNTVNFGGNKIFGLASNGFNLSFKVPVTAMPGNVLVSVENANGKSNPVSFTVIPKPAPLIISILPNIGPVGAKVVVAGTGFTSVGNIVKFGDISLFGIPSNGFTMSFKIPKGASPGNVNVSVKNSNGTSNPVIFTVIPICPPRSICPISLSSSF